MSDTSTGLSFEEFGIARALSQRALRVPLNQRSYAWEDDQVQTLFDDLLRAFYAGESIYFLGTVVLTPGVQKEWEIADGQQRLATTSILVAAVRDYLIELGDDDGAAKYQSAFLLDYDVRSKDWTPQLYLNSEDHEFFVRTILKAPRDREVFDGVSFQSHKRLERAAQLSAEHIRNMTKAVPDSEKANRLYDWIDFLQDSAKVIVIMVQGRVGNAFKMFETLNARGTDASKADILKNYLYDLAQKKLGVVHPQWISMLSTIESYGEDDLLIKFLRHFWISRNGHTTEAELGTAIESTIKSERQAVDLIGSLNAGADDYAALLSPADHPRWAEYSKQSRDAVHTISKEIKSEQIRPLMLAVARNFDIPEAQKAFVAMVSWSVRFLIAGTRGGGVLERAYGSSARAVYNGEISTTEQLRERLQSVVPSDTLFKSAFENATVSKAHLARYYLRAIETFSKDSSEKNPQLLPNDDTQIVNLEHVLPINPSDEWDIEKEVASAMHRRLGNMALLNARQNVKLANLSFANKKDVLAASPFVTTSVIGKCETWGKDEIAARQARLAEMATSVWPL